MYDHMRTPIKAVLCLLVSAFIAPLAQAQFRTAIQGTVADPSGAVIPDSMVTLVDKQTNQTLTSTTNSEGIYNFNGLPPSTFKLTISADGFATKVIDDLKVIAEQQNSVNITLAVGQKAEEVTVSGSTIPAIDTATANISGEVTANQIEHLPSFGRDVLTLSQLAPGTFGDGGQGASGGVRSLPGSNQAGTTSTDGVTKTENQPQIVGNGNQTNTSNIMIDGVSTSSVTWGGSTVITPSEESVDNVKVSPNVYDAEFGRFTGTNIQITSKGGTNQIHGSLFFRGERPGLNAYQRWNGPNSVGAAAAGKTPQQRGLNRDTSRFNQYGGSAGFPLWHDKLFGFFSFERIQVGGVSYGTAWFETDAYRAAARSGSLAQKILTAPGIAPRSAGLTSNNSCQAIGLVEGPNCHYIAGQGMDVGSPMTTAVGSYDPTRLSATTPGVGNGLDGVADIANFATVNPNSKTGDQYYGRMDAQVTQKDRLSFMIYHEPTNSYSINGPARGYSTWLNSRLAEAFTGLWNHTFMPSFLNEARVNAASWRWNELQSNPTIPFGVPNLTLSDNLGSGLPTNPSSFAAASPSIFDQWTYGYQDIATLVHGRHATKFGASLTRLYYLNQNTGAARPTYNFGGLWNFLNDAYYQESGSFNPSTGALTSNRQDNRNNFFGAFVQDDWKVTPTLTLNLGIRYDYFGPFYDKANNLRVAVLGDGANMVSGIVIRKGGGLYNVQKGNMGPQLGFAWSPSALNGRGVIRGGFGLNYNQNEMAITASGNGNPGNTLNFTFCCKTAAGVTNTGAGVQYALGSDQHNIFSYPANPNAITTYASTGLPTTGTIGVTAYDTNDHSIQTYHYSLDTQYDIGRGWVGTLGYQGSVSHHLLLQQDKNVVAATSGFALNPRLSRVGYYGNVGNANYHAMLATLRHNFAHGYQLEGQYTWSKSMDQGSQPYYQDTYPYAMDLSYGQSDYNVGQALRLFGMYQPNFFHKQQAHTLLDGWTLSGIFNAHTGFPWTPTVGTNAQQFFAGSGQTTLRPALYYGNAKHDTSNSAFESGPTSISTTATNQDFSNGSLAYFAVPAFSNAGTGYTGASTSVVAAPQRPGVSRNSFTGPRYSSLDASLTKGFHLPNMPVLGERSILEFRVDAFNLFNQVNLNSLSTSIGTATTTAPAGSTKVTYTFAPNYSFGQATNALAGRIVAMQARFSF